MKTRGIIATTNIDAHNCIITDTALRDMAEQINRNTKLPVNIQHDISVPPLGFVLDAEILPIEDALALWASQKFFDIQTSVQLPDGSLGEERKCDGETFRFKMPFGSDPEDLHVEVDPTSFASHDDLEKFTSGFEAPDGLSLRIGQHMRKSVIPDPTVIVQLAQSLGLVYLTTRFLGAFASEAGKSAGQQAAEIGVTVRHFIGGAFRRFLEATSLKQRPITYLVRIPGEPNVQLVARSDGEKNIDFIIRAYCEKDFGDLYKYSQQLHSAFDVDLVQFLLDEQGEWKFNFLLTKLGTQASFDRQTQVLNRMEEELKQNLSSQGSGQDRPPLG